MRRRRRRRRGRRRGQQPADTIAYGLAGRWHGRRYDRRSELPPPSGSWPTTPQTGSTWPLTELCGRRLSPPTAGPECHDGSSHSVRMLVEWGVWGRVCRLPLELNVQKAVPIGRKWAKTHLLYVLEAMKYSKTVKFLRLTAHSLPTPTRRSKQ